MRKFCWEIFGIVDILGKVKVMLIEFLIEDRSGEKLINEVMCHYKNEAGREDICYHTLSYKGIGGLNKGKDAITVKSNHLLSELPKRMRAIQYQNIHRSDVTLFVVVDNDKNNTELFYSELKNLAEKHKIRIDHVFCIAVEEMEAWLLGDFDAIQKAYPEMKDRIISKYSGYIQDSICDTWELLADMLTKNGIKEFLSKNHSVYEIGQKKYEWAEKIGKYMNIRNNKSPSFNRFLAALDKRM